KKLAADTVKMLGWGCPGTPMVQLKALWACRQAADLDAEIEKILTWIEDAVEPPGCSSKLGLCDPISIVGLVGEVDHPAAARIARKLVPMLIRDQHADGSWGQGEEGVFGFRSFTVMRALAKHGLLEELTGFDPLPPEWEVVREIPSPAKKPWGLVFDGEKLWVHEREPHSAVAVSPEDGKVLATVPLPDEKWVYPLGLWDGGLTLTSNGGDGQRFLYKIDSGSGDVLEKIPLDFMGFFTGPATQLNGKLIFGDHWDGGAKLVDMSDPRGKKKHLRVPGTPMAIAPAGEEIWVADTWAPAFLRTNVKGDLLEWAEKPFGHHALAHDGENLWALDKEKKRICVVRRVASGDVKSEE
ncbi:MAG: hypothetical protein ACYTGB_10325, partial [Planctomycetota bacterium]